MNAAEVSCNIVVAMINNRFLATPEDISEAYKTIYKAVRFPDED